MLLLRPSAVGLFRVGLHVKVCLLIEDPETGAYQTVLGLTTIELKYGNSYK
jgi:hypothetical protein